MRSRAWYLTLLVATQHQGVLGRIQIQPDNGFELFGELRVAAELEGLDPMRFEAVLLPNPSHAGGADARRPSHRTGGPMGGVGRLLLRGHAHDARDGLLADFRGATGPRRILFEAADAQLEETRTPAGGLLDADSELLGDLLILLAPGGEQHDSRSFDDARRSRSRAAALFEDFSLLRARLNGWGDTHAGDL